MRGNPFLTSGPAAASSMEDLSIEDGSWTKEEEPKKDKFIVESELLIPGKGDPITNGSIVVEGNKITKVGHSSSIATEYSHLPKYNVKVLMPGMWDCHVHFIAVQAVAWDAILQSQQKQALTGARCAPDLMRLLDAGFTSVREMAGCGIQLDEAVEEGSLVGPKIYSSNSIISPTGGHADLHPLPKPWFDDLCAHGSPFQTADGVPECLKIVRMQLRAGAKVIKICGSGGVGSELDNPVDQQFSSEEMEAMVQEAARAQRIIGAHCHGKAGIMAALHAGVKTIEHGSYLDDEAADLMIEKNAILVTTRLIVENGLKSNKDFFSSRGYAKLREIAAHQFNAMQTAIRKGVTCAIGTDSTGTLPPGNPLSKLVRQGLNAMELYYHVKAGMTPLQAIEAATANGPLTLGPQAPKAGQLKEGYDADFIGVDANPLEDIKILIGPDHVSHVWKQGICYKSPGKPISFI
ncbi:hypothetical protein LTR78_002172 [Recurvomyces mirabilis]|uniref:Amidohydrolase-related domain-containing protein n=1 Tax=Recurvomyces mirabilis TaxID=574656 RepID=A0AAE1C4S0_9PEZI|nr:hypothetical protein LTR78_002172 [Recurvomyces mirabilis]KAK5160629.1 hypothetical protein LTS14_001641 [Recurvomyces mirabilis]